MTAPLRTCVWCHTQFQNTPSNFPVCSTCASEPRSRYAAPTCATCGRKLRSGIDSVRRNARNEPVHVKCPAGTIDQPCLLCGRPTSHRTMRGLAIHAECLSDTRYRRAEPCSVCGAATITRNESGIPVHPRCLPEPRPCVVCLTPTSGRTTHLVPACATHLSTATSMEED